LTFQTIDLRQVGVLAGEGVSGRCVGWSGGEVRCP
jgi:hypothetical protein